MDEIGDDDMLAAGQAAEKRFQHRESGPSNTPNRSTTSSGPKIQQPTPQALPQRSLPSSILVSSRQKGNPILSHITALPWEYTDTPADYVLGQTTCALFLSLKYHRLHPEYVYSRIRGLAGRYNLRVLLVMVDIDNHEEPLRELAKTSLVNDLTLVLAWSAREAARYLEAYRSLERADPTGIRGARATTFAEHMTEFVTTPRGVNKTDAVSLVGSLGNVRNAVNAEKDMITAIPGWGEKKTERLIATVNEPFRVGRARARKGRDREGTGAEPLKIGMLKAREASSLIEAQSYNASRDTPDANDGVEGAASGTKRGMNEVLAEEPEDDGDEASLFLAAKEADSTNPRIIVALTEEDETIRTTETTKKKTDEPLLSEGIQAALAKLRQQ